MFEDLRAFLNQLTNPEQTQQIMFAAQTIYDSGYTEIENQINQELAYQDIIGLDLAFDLTYKILIPRLTGLLREFGIHASPDAGLGQLSRLYADLQLIDTYSNKTAIISRLEQDLDNEEILADILALVGEWSSEEYLLVISRVSDSLLDRIADVLDEVEFEAIADADVRTAAVSRVKHYLSQVESGWIADKIRDGLVCGLSYDEAFALCRNELSTMWEEQPRKAIDGWVGLYLSTSASLDDIDQHATTFIHNNTESVLEATPLMSYFHSVVSTLRIAE